MSLKNKLRNIRIFGVRSELPKKTTTLIILGIIVAVTFVFAKFALTESTNQNKLTGMVVQENTQETANNPQSNIQQQTQKEQSNAQTSEGETTEKETEEGTKKYEWYEYKEECSLNIKNSEDDLKDIKGYLNKRQSSYDQIKAEYDQKLKDLEKEYENKLTNSEEDVNEAQTDLENTESRLENYYVQCEY